MPDHSVMAHRLTQKTILALAGAALIKIFCKPPATPEIIAALAAYRKKKNDESQPGTDAADR
jgi:hypothetical protein